MYVVGNGPNGKSLTLKTFCHLTYEDKISFQQLFGIIISMASEVAVISSIPIISPIMASLLCCRTFFVARD